MQQETPKPHKRRVRYKGKYPKKFEEKYKELNPEKYQDTVEHVIRKGQYTGRYAHFHYGEGNPGFSENPAGRDRI